MGSSLGHTSVGPAKQSALREGSLCLCHAPRLPAAAPEQRPPWTGGSLLTSVIPTLGGEADVNVVCGFIMFSANYAFSSSRCHLDTYKELLKWPIKKKTERKTDIPTSFPVRLYFFLYDPWHFDEMWHSFGASDFACPGSAAIPVLGDQSPGSTQLLGFAPGVLGACPQPRALQPVLLWVWRLSLCSMLRPEAKRVPPVPAGQAPPPASSPEPQSRAAGGPGHLHLSDSVFLATRSESLDQGQT